MSNKKSKDTDNGIISKHNTKVVFSSLILAGTLILGTITGFSVTAVENSSITSTAINNQEIGGGEAAANITSLSTTNNVTAEAATIPNKQITLIAEDVELEIAPGKRINTWTFNGTVPGPTLRFTEGDNVTILFINKSPTAHTIHFHGNHDDENDGVDPLIQPNGNYTYRITAEPAGAMMYHCHAHPTSYHIRMGMYGALIIDPKDKPVLQPAKEYVMVMSEFNDKKIQEYPITLETDYYLINGYKNQYHKYYPLEINTYDTIRLYIINIGTTIPYPFHLHSTTFKAYPSGLLDNEPIHVQTIPVAPGDAVIVEAKWKYPGTYLFHSHGIQEERGNMGNITVTDGGNNKDSTSNLSTSNTITTMIGKTTPLSKSVSMFEWQYEKQKELQKPVAINYREQEPIVINDTEDIVINDTQQKPIVINYTQEEHNEEKDNTSNTSTSAAISIVPGSSNPNNPKFYDPSPANVTVGTTVTWTNNDSALHTVTSGNSTSGPSGVFDSSIMSVGGTFQHTFDKAGTFDYYCILHPFMIAQVVVK